MDGIGHVICKLTDMNAALGYLQRLVVPMIQRLNTANHELAQVPGSAQSKRLLSEVMDAIDVLGSAFKYDCVT